MSGAAQKEKWHVGKEIPLAMIFAILCQTGGWIWWAATMSAKLDDLSYQVASLTADKYTRTDAQKDGALFAQRTNELDRRVTNLENRRR